MRALESWQQAGSQHGGRAMLVASFRSEEVGPGHMLRRLKPSAHLRLATFGAAEVARMAESMAGALPPDAGAAPTVCGGRMRAELNPLTDLSESQHHI